MAQDPHSDLLPVKEENSFRTVKGVNEKIDHQLVTKLSRCDLEDRCLRLLDEQTHLKKQINCQEEKLKRLGTKLLRLISEKKSNRKSCSQGKETEELQTKILELEHENYILKDKNTVLKQQLASHSRHNPVPRSPVRSIHTSPLMSNRHCHQSQNEIMYDTNNKNETADSQVQDAETHIKELNDEIKSLHCKINCLKQDIEKNCLDSRKTKVSENIELIRLQRSIKQQAIQIAVLQAQVKNSEHNQEILKEELSRAHSENDETLNLISQKQNDIINLCGKLDEKNMSKLEEDELRERIKDLMKERDFLKERSDFLMKKIGEKGSEAEMIKNLQKLVAEEKSKQEELRVALEKTQMHLKDLQNSKEKAKSTGGCCFCQISIQPLVLKSEAMKTPKIEDCVLYARVMDSNPKPLEDNLSKSCELTDLGDSSDKSNQCNCVDATAENDDVATTPVLKDESEIVQGQVLKEKDSAEKLKLVREVQFLREMLRNQTSRCESQQKEISRLMYELKVNEENCNRTMEKLDSHLKAFQNSEYRLSRNSGITPVKVSIMKNEFSETSEREENNETMSLKSAEKMKVSEPDNQTIQSFKTDADPAQNDFKEPNSNYGEKKRFVDQVFLDSSDEDIPGCEYRRRDAAKRSVRSAQLNRKPGDQSVKSNGRNGVSSAPARSGPNASRKYSVNSFTSALSSELNLSQKKLKGSDRYKELKSSKIKTRRLSEVAVVEDEVEISILWFQIEMNSVVWENENVKSLFVDFSFLDVRGEETETPVSQPTPSSPDEKCLFNFSKSIPITKDKKKILNSMLNKIDLDLIIFKVVSEPENSPEELDCEDVGVAAVTVKQFLDNSNKGPFMIPVQNMKNYNEIIGKLAISVNATQGVFVA